MINMNISDKIKSTQKEYSEKLNNADNINKNSKSKSRSVKEKYKEIKDSFVQKDITNYNFDYEEFLKKQLFNQELEEKELIDALNNEKLIFDSLPEESQIIKNNGLWDYVLEDEIKYFDPKKSYELTGYRPINETEGLDFDPELFRETAKIYETTGNYTEYPKGSKPYADFWQEQIRRCKEGYTIGKYRITGDHYFFLNFYRMKTIIEKQNAGSGRLENFPSFLAKQYEFFHYVEMAEKLKKDICILKARGLGLSEIVACLAVRPYITNRGYRTLLTCASAEKLDPLKSKCWLQLNWLDANTNGGMRQLRQKKNNDNTKRASQVTKDGVEYGWGSEIDSVVADTSDKIRGDRVDRLIFEEAGSNKNLIKSWIQSGPLVELGGDHFGTRIALGTGGDDMALEGLATIFSNPEAYNVLPYMNYDTEDEQPQLTAFFIPAHKFGLKREYLDNRGVTNSIKFKEYYETQRKKLSGKDLLDYCAEHCFVYNEALFKQGDNIFDTVMIADRLSQLRVQKLGIKPQKVDLLWDCPNADLNLRNKVKIVNNESGKIFIYEPPIKDNDGNPYKNLYVAGIDAIDQGTDDSSTNKDVSDFCIVIKKRILGSSTPNYVAIYKDRPRDIVTAYENAMKLLVLYNCKAMLEHTKISILMYFRSKKKESLIMNRPKSTLSDIRKGNSSMYGYPASEPYLKHGLDLIKQFVNEYCYSIQIDSMLEQLLKYSWENKRKFDIIAAMIAAELGDEDMFGFTPKIQNSKTNNWKDFGWYYDSYGNKRYGTIPK